MNLLTGPLLGSIINTVSSCQSFSSQNFSPSVPTPTAGSLRNDAHHVRTSCRLVRGGPSSSGEHWESVTSTLPCPVTTYVKHFIKKTEHGPLITVRTWYLHLIICDSCKLLTLGLLFGWISISHSFAAVFTLCILMKLKGQGVPWRVSEKRALRCGKMLHAQMLTTCCYGNGFGSCRLQDSCYF